MKTHQEIELPKPTEIDRFISESRSMVGQVRQLTATLPTLLKDEPVDLSALVVALGNMAARMDKIVAALEKERKIDLAQTLTITNNQTNKVWTVKVNR